MTAPPRGTGLADRFAATAARYPHATALVASGVRRSYAELADRAAAIAHATTAACGRRPARVAVLGERGLATFEAYLGALYCGASVVPLSPAYPADRLAEIAKLAWLDCLLYPDRHAELAEQLRAARPGLVALDLAKLPDVGRLHQPVAATDGAYVVFTSGSAGRPKGVPISHGNISAYLDAMRDYLASGPQDVMGQSHELTFDFSVLELWIPWDTGGCVSVISPVLALDPARAVAERGLTMFAVTPSLADAAAALDRLRPGSMPGLRHAVFCGEPLTEQTAQRWHAAAPDAEIHNLYGPTELTVSCTRHRWRSASGRPTSAVVPIGPPHPQLAVRLLDGNGRVVSWEGELCMAGDQLFGGYLDPADDADRFVELAGRRWYRTGDRVARMPDGTLHYLGRIDDQLKIRGYRVEPREIELTARRLAPGRKAVAVAVDGPAAASLVLFLAGEPVDPLAIRAQIAAELPPYLVPAEVHWIPRLPLTAHGKADRVVLTRLAKEHLTGESAGDPAGDPAGPVADQPSPCAVNPDGWCGPMIKYSNMPRPVAVPSGPEY